MRIRSFLGGWGRKRGEKYAKKLLQKDKNLLVVLAVNNLPGANASEAGFNIYTGKSKLEFLCLTNKRLLTLQKIWGTNAKCVSEIPLKNIKSIQYDDNNTVIIKNKKNFEHKFGTVGIDRKEIIEKMISDFNKLT